MIHPKTGQYVLCDICGGIATVINENPTLNLSDTEISNHPASVPQISVTQFQTEKTIFTEAASQPNATCTSTVTSMDTVFVETPINLSTPSERNTNSIFCVSQGLSFPAESTSSLQVLPDYCSCQQFATESRVFL